MQRFESQNLSKLLTIAFPLLAALATLVATPRGFAADEKKTIRVLMAKDRGGFGDVATNITMAEKLAREAGPAYDVELILFSNADGTPSQEQQKVSQLWTEYQAQLPHQILAHRGGLRVSNLKSKKEDAVHPGQNLPIDVSFSVRQYAGPGLFHQDGRINLGYLELGDFKHEISKGDYSPRAGLTVTNPIPGHLGLELATGAGAGGLYISTAKPAPPVSRDEYLRRLAINFPEISPTAEFAVAYSRTGRTTLHYVQAVTEYARRNPFRNFVLLSLSSAVPDLSTAPSNLRVISTQSLPFELFQSAIAFSDLPPLVGGDSSVSTAIDFEKPFLYELFAWKTDSADLLMNEIANFSPSISHTPELHHLLERSLHIDVSGGGASAEFFLSVFENADYRAEFTNAIRQMRKRNSLVRTVMNDIWLKSQKNVYLVTEHSIAVIRKTLLDTDPQNLFDVLRTRAADLRLNTKDRIDALRAVLEFRTSGVRENLELVKSLLANENDHGHYSIIRFFANNIRSLAIRYYIASAARGSDLAARAGAIAVLDSLDAQESAQFSLGQAEGAKLRETVRTCRQLF